MVNLQEILKLSAAEKILMVEEIWGSIEKESVDVLPSQRDELDKRLKRYQEGATKFFSWEDVKKDIYSALKK
jgi:putative addiction module component (TIGR02574 family)